VTDIDPVRLRDSGSDAPSELRLALDEASDVPVERLARVAARLGPGGSGPGSGSQSGPVAPRPLRTSGMVGIAAIAIGVGLVVWQTLPRSDDRPPTTPQSPPPPATAPGVSSGPAPSPVVVPGPAPSSAPPSAAPVERAPPRSRPPAVVDNTEVESESEAQLLLRARRALAADASRTLAIVREHARRFPDGELLEEREALRIEALVGIDRIADARAAYAQFRARFAGSAHLPHLSQLLSSAARQ
jgi:hypothetical protein